MWRRAIEAETEAKVRAELKEQTNRKIARVKGKLIERIETCEKALAEAETKAKTEASLRIEAEQAAQSHAEGLEKVTERTRRETKLRIEAEQRAKMEAHARSIAEARLKAETELRAEAEQKAECEAEMRAEAETTAESLKRSSHRRAAEGLGPADASDNHSRTASCEGCGRDNVPENDMSRIESGQLVCSNCMMVART